MLTITAVGDRLTPNAEEAENEDTADIRIELEKEDTSQMNQYWLISLDPH